MLFILLSCSAGEPPKIESKPTMVISEQSVKQDLDQMHKKLDCMTELMTSEPSYDCQNMIANLEETSHAIKEPSVKTSAKPVVKTRQ